MVQSILPRFAIEPPSIFASNERDAFLKAMRSPWYSLIGDLQDVLLSSTVQYARSRGLKSLYLPLTTRTTTCPTALGSDSEPVRVTVDGVDTYLPDSMQFLLEYGCRVAPGGCYNIMPSFRGGTPDSSHLGQFTHSEVEMPGDIYELMDYVDGYVKALAEGILEQHGDQLAKARGDISHLERMASHSGAFERLTFDEAVAVVGDVDGCVRDEGTWRMLNRKGERLLMDRVSEFMWVHHFDNLAVPFYQAYGDEDGKTAACADMYFGMGEVVGSGERHGNASDLRKSMKTHNVNEHEYDWYVRMREETPIRTSGFGMGVERFLMWVLKHDDIRDIPLVSRVDELLEWPAVIARP